MPRVKNVALHPVDVGGRVLASGETADLDTDIEAVAHGLEVESLRLIQDAPGGDTAHTTARAKTREH